MDSANEALGLPREARTLIVSADDFGMYGEVNEAVVRAFEDGIVSSCGLMPPCPAAEEAMAMLRARPHLPFGIHLTLLCDTPARPWGPLTARERVPSLLDGRGALFTPDRLPELLAQARPEEAETEFRAQLDAVAAAGLTPTHLDWHCLADGGRPDIFDLTLALADEHGLAVRAWLPSSHERLGRRGLTSVEHDFVDSFTLDPATKEARCEELLRTLPPGLSEWAVHPGLDTPEARSLDPDGWHVRSTDLAHVTSPRARELLDEEGIVVTDYAAVSRAWERVRTSERARASQ
ncbi:ChbG/HpnK family deacetylase [Streptomyces sp. NBC_01186]|uniref:carbohydrate deacetylase n=1 Tax=Streptomyces sp. NBC_01186 TaxID=2903765 RepID=UPI002E0F9419|nr:ChbG/HpnK family deacetylase [Streptomyces sp. NBC_01186]